MQAEIMIFHCWSSKLLGK